MTLIVRADDEVSFEHEVLEAPGSVLVDFWAEWCGPCHLVAPEVEALAEKYADALKVVKVDVDANGAVAERYDIQGIPTLVLFRGGKPVAGTVGAKPREVIEAELGLAP